MSDGESGRINMSVIDIKFYISLKGLEDVLEGVYERIPQYEPVLINKVLNKTFVKMREVLLSGDILSIPRFASNIKIKDYIIRSQIVSIKCTTSKLIKKQYGFKK